MARFSTWREAVRLMGPAFLVSVAYLDPGNWATAIEGGSRFGYDLVWVVVLSNLIAILLQTLAARLGLVTGKHLAELCREEYPRLVSVLLWVLCEISIVALDLTMVIGTAVGLNLLFHLPLLQCILLSGLDSLLLVLLVPSLGLRRGELLTVCLIFVVVLCFLGDLLLSKPPLTKLVSGLWPRLTRDSLYTAVSLLGANVMPHNFYLHSALVSVQAKQMDRSSGPSLEELCRYNLIDIAAALGVALLVNVAVMLVAAATFHSAGITVNTLQDAHDVMEQILSSSLAPMAFGTALLCAGQLSTFTGTISGQVVLKGFMNINLKVWVRRLLTRSAAIAPAAILQVMYGSAAIYQMLLIAQVVLALQLPFTLVPLIKITSSASHMGAFANGRAVQLAAWAAALLIFAANLMLFLDMIWPAAAEIQTASEAPTALAILTSMLAELRQAPFHGLAYLACVVLAAAALSLILWMIVTPLKDAAPSKDHLAPLLSHKADDWWEPGSPEALEAAGALAEQDQLGRVEVGRLQLTQCDNRHRPHGGAVETTSEVPRGALPATEGAAVLDIRGEEGRPGDNGSWSGSRSSSGSPTGSGSGRARSSGGSEPEDWEDLVDIVTIGGRHAPHPHLSLPLAAGAPQPPARPEAPGAGSSAGAQPAAAGLGQGKRRQCAALLDAFWGELYDPHGEPVLHSWAARGGRAGAEGRGAEEEAEAVERVARCLECLSLQAGSALLQARCEEAALAHVEQHVDSLARALRPAAPGGLPHLDLFGFWSILRMLQFMQAESRPELWGRYSSVLNKLQGVLLWSTPTGPQADFTCRVAGALQGHVTGAEANVQGRLPPAAAPSAEQAFGKGKQIAFSVLKRYRRHLSRTGRPAML
mmetsp:Transcript_46020/g.116456  ORF Transcript_46020/g.116456 Transcript_46020/m.116456 type:complete len:872 (-) Transcript_46020:137-2752(-)